MNIRLVLLPFSILYGGIMTLRNWLYDIGLLRHKSFSLPVICVGNITVGGTGKTPFIEFLIHRLHSLSPAIVSRGYRRSTKGLVVANQSSTVADIGDEPSQMHRKFPDITVVVDENRAEAIDWVANNTNSRVVLMDDGFQHRSAKASFYILMTDFARPMWNDWTFPAGNMREPWRGRHRADIVVVNKCPSDMSEQQRDEVIRLLNVSCPVFFTTIDYGTPVMSNGNIASSHFGNVTALAGIGRPEPFFDAVRHLSDNVQTISFPDHHNFSPDDINSIKASLADGRQLVTTEKDAMRLADSGIEFIYLPIQLKVLFGQQSQLDDIISKATLA